MFRPEIFIQIALVIGVAAIGYAMLIRPQLARMAQQHQFIASLKLGDHVVVSGGLIGVIVACDHGRTVDVKFSEGVRMQVMRTAIDGVFEA